MINVTNHKSYGSVLIAVTEVCKRVIYMLDDIIVIFNLCLYHILYV